MAASAAQADAERIEQAGDVLQLALPAAAWGLTVQRGDSRGRGMLYRSFASTLAATYALKYTVHAPRPESQATNAFPSGHTAAAFSGASFIQRRYGWSLGTPAYALAGFVGYSRVRADAHYVRDVVAGAGLATALSYIFTDPEADGARVTAVSADTDGLRLVGRF